MGAGARLVLLACVVLLGAAGSAPAREWRAPWAGIVEQSAQAAGSETPPIVAVTEANLADDRATGVDISMADLMADGSELAGVAPRAATSGIGPDVERDLFSNGVPLNAPEAQPPANDDPRDFLY